MEIIVQKFGGTSVSTKERRKMVIEKIKETLNLGAKPVVVVSAMGRKGDPYATDSLLSLISSEFKSENKMATDMLMCCGEIISTVVMSNELLEAGIEAVPLTGGQAGILTDNKYSSAEPIDINTKTIIDIVKAGKIPVIAGFQGIDREGFFTTLGRGGSDTTASFLGTALKAKEIQIFTDVDGIMTADPRIVKDAELIDRISYAEIFELADQGAKVIHPRAVEAAMRGNIPLVIRNTMSDCKGTVIDNIGDLESQNVIVGITHQGGRIQVSLDLLENQDNKEKYKVALDILGKKHISIDLVNIFPKEKVFTISDEDVDLFKAVMDEHKIKYNLIENLSKIAMVGSKMRGIPGVVANVVSALDNEGIDVLQSADSHMTIWCLVETPKVKQAIKSLHKAFL
ncbi:MAG: aspartate kinase [Sarcina sp.]